MPDGSPLTITAPGGSLIRTPDGLVQSIRVGDGHRVTLERREETFEEYLVGDDSTKPAPLRTRDVYVLTSGFEHVIK